LRPRAENHRPPFRRRRTARPRSRLLHPEPTRLPMTRRHFLCTAAASTLAFGARAAEPRLRVAVIGHTGKGDYGHGLNTMWLSMPETEIVGVADADATGLAGALKKLKVTAGFADYRELLAKTKPDIVAVCPRQAGEHRDMAL